MKNEKRRMAGARALKNPSRQEDFSIINKKADCT